MAERLNAVCVDHQICSHKTAQRQPEVCFNHKEPVVHHHGSQHTAAELPHFVCLLWQARVICGPIRSISDPLGVLDMLKTNNQNKLLQNTKHNHHSYKVSVQSNLIFLRTHSFYFGDHFVSLINTRKRWKRRYLLYCVFLESPSSVTLKVKRLKAK